MILQPACSPTRASGVIEAANSDEALEFLDADSDV